ncbi:MAG: 7-cyano-7-deazaguanine synthase, partial [Methanocorpusculum sp.]|nr:7-cyano-7-deazaguanine synthase [Methanocorpusculum sp.]
MKKAVCLLSGGMDSTTLAFVAKKMGYDILALHVNYGQRTEKKELECAKKIAER